MDEPRPPLLLPVDQILFDGRDFNLEEVDKQGEILINGKKKRRASKRI
ncbi:MAG: hypothetical protein ACLP1X_32570 [Polyangiaceae bacterium]